MVIGAGLSWVTVRSRDKLTAEINQGKTMAGHDWPLDFLFPTYRYIGTDASGDRVTTDRSLPLPGAKQAENVAARQPSILCIRSFFYYCLF